MDFKFLRFAFHCFTGVVVIGSGWRLLSLHLVASGNMHLQHLGCAMQLQY